nr:uncharacterized protein LOC127321666 [Lolium perenne]
MGDAVGGGGCSKGKAGAARPPEAVGRMARVEEAAVMAPESSSGIAGADKPAVEASTCAGVATGGALTCVAAAVLGSGGGAENIEPTTVVPKNCGICGASGDGGELRRAASDAGEKPGTGGARSRSGHGDGGGGWVAEVANDGEEWCGGG